MTIMFRWFRVATGCCLLLALSAIGFGQSQPHTGKINVAFEFDVGGTKFPAGEYVLELVSPSYGMIRSSDGKTQQTLYFMQTGEPEKNPKAAFVVRNQKYFFSGVSAWFGKMQYTGFNPRPEDKTREIPITPTG